MSENTLNSHWENPKGPRALKKKVYYKKDVDKIIERSLVFDSWDDAWEVQEAIFDRIKVHCRWAQNDKFFDNVGNYKKQVKEIKRLCFYWRRFKQIRINICAFEAEKRMEGI